MTSHTVQGNIVFLLFGEEVEVGTELRIKFLRATSVLVGEKRGLVVDLSRVISIEGTAILECRNSIVYQDQGWVMAYVFPGHIQELMRTNDILDLFEGIHFPTREEAVQSIQDRFEKI